MIFILFNILILSNDRSWLDLGIRLYVGFQPKLQILSIYGLQDKLPDTTYNKSMLDL